MARYLVYTSPARGHLYPVVPTLEELRRRGHEVVVRTLASEVGLLRGLGFEAESIDPAIERKEHADWRARTPIGALQDNLQVFFERARHDGPAGVPTSCRSPRVMRLRLAWGFRLQAGYSVASETACLAPCCSKCTTDSPRNSTLCAQS